MAQIAPGPDKYQARWDAETLAQAEEVKSDPKRLASAKKKAAALAEEQAKQVKTMKKIAGRKKPSPAKKGKR